MIIEVNNIQLNYEVYGSGSPVIFLHGNGESLNIFKEISKHLSHQHTVYLIDSRGHGASSKTDTLNYNEMAIDIFQFIHKLKIEKPILFGFSDGGIIGLILAGEHPELLSKLIVAGVNIQPDGLTDEAIEKIKIWYEQDPSLLTKMMLEEPNIPTYVLHAIKIPVIMYCAEKDIIKPEHTKMIYDNISNSTLHILPEEDHASYIFDNEKLLKNIQPYMS